MIADAFVALTGVLVRWVDPTALDVHLVRKTEPFGSAFPLPVVTDNCVPRASVLIRNVEP